MEAIYFKSSLKKSATIGSDSEETARVKKIKI